MIPSPSRLRLGLRSKLFMLIVFAFGALVLSIVWQIDRKAGDLARQTIDRSLAQSTRVLAADLNRRFSDIEEVAVSITRDGRVMPLVYERAALTLQDLAMEFERALNFNVLMFLDSEGRVLARNDRAEAAGQVLAGRSALVDAALTGQRAQGYFVSGGQLMQMLAVPVFDNVAEGLVRGAVLIAYTLSADIASEIRELTDSEVAFAIFTYDANRTVNGAEIIYSTDPTITSTLNPHLTDEGRWRQYFSAVTPAEQLKLDLGGDTYFASLQPLANGGDPPLGFALALRSRTELLRPFHALQQRILLTAAVCLALAALLAWFLAQRVTRPIIAMAAVARDIQQGRYPEDPGPILRRDEVGALQRAVFAMGRSLQEKAALEHYLATVTEELEPDEELLGDASLLALPDPAAAQESDDDRPSANLQGDVPSGEPSLAGEGRFKEPMQAKGADTTQLRLEPVEHSPVELAVPADPTLLHASDRSSVAAEVEPFNAVLFDGRYELHRLLGTGGTGRVYLALDNELRERVAIKLIDRELLTKYTNFDFREEIRLARKITHRNIVRIYDFGSTDEYWYITMEYIPGLNLDTLLNRRGAQKMAIGIMLVRQICYAMQAAHEQGVIHCDLKPSNIMINRQGILKIMDFGLAVTAVAQAATSSVPSQVIGTPRYMAPEQYLGQPLDVRTDLYAIGLIMYAIFVGSPPYADVAAEDLALAHLKWPLPPLPAQAMQLSPGLPAIIERCTAKAPADRYPSVRALLDDLAALGPIGDASAP